MRRLVLALPFCVAACVTSPTPERSTADQTVPVAVRVLTYQTEQPIARATVLRSSTPIGATDEYGLFVFEVERGTTIRLAAVKDGYAHSIVAEGDINGPHERWTFYLEPMQ